MFCQYCGKEINEGQDVCLGCGRAIERKKVKNNNGYFMTSSIIMIVLAIIFILGSQEYEILDITTIFIVPGIFALIGGILTITGRKNKIMVISGGVLYFIGMIINSIGIKDISLFGIMAIVFGILNIVFGLKIKD